MHLLYRGSTYEVTLTPLDMPETLLTGKYRGLPITFKAPMGVTQPQAVATLTYRGNAYLRLR